MSIVAVVVVVFVVVIVSCDNGGNGDNQRIAQIWHRYAVGGVIVRNNFKYFVI